MRWTNELFYILFLNSITGAIAYGFWSVLKKNMARRKKLKYIYPMLGIVEAFFIFPIMYIYLKISTHVPGSHGAYYGTLFLRTPFIYNVQCVIAGIWIVGAVWNLAKYVVQYLKFQKVLEKSVSFRLPETEKNKIIQELGMKGNVELYQNYAVTSPIVIGWRQKKIIFPVREYEENPLCGFTFSDDAFFALNDLLKETYGFHGWHCTNRKLPVLFLSGGDDPCYVNVRRFKKSIDHMRLIGYRNVRGKLYPGMRHEILNEKEKYRVYGDVWKWLKKEKVVENVEGGSTPPQTPDGALAGSGGV